MRLHRRLSVPGAFRRSVGKEDGDGPLDPFIRAIEVGRFDGWIGRIAPVAFTVVVAVVAARLGTVPALAIGAGLAVGLVVACVAWQRSRWRAQEVLHGYANGRERAWLRDTGGPNPTGDPVAAEVWLGVHKAGTVPQFYRAIAAGAAADEHRYGVELSRMTDGTPTERALKLFAVEGRRFRESGTADIDELTTLVGELPSSPLRVDLESWLALVKAQRRWSLGQRDWLAPLEAEQSRSERQALPFGQRLRIWVGRLRPVLVFAVGSLVLGSFAVRDAGSAAIRPEYERTTYAIRGDLPRFDDQAFVRTLPGLEQALSSATRAVEGPLDEAAFDDVVSNSLPTLLWTTGAIEVAKPADAGSHRVWEIEVLLGSGTRASAILTFDGAFGPRYLYRIDPAAFDAVRAAGGLPPATDN